MKYFSSLTLMSGFGTPEETHPGSIALTAELTYVPSLSVEQRRVGFIGSKVEDLNRTNVFGRVSMTIGLPRRLTLTAGVTPPLEINGVRPELLSLSLARPLHESRRWRLGARLHGHTGTIAGDLVCPKGIVGRENPVTNPDDCLEPSKDEMRQRAVGLEVSVSPVREGSTWEPHLALSVNYLDLEFAIRARYSVFLDRAILVADGRTYSLTAGVKRRVSNNLELLAEAFYAPLDVVRRVASGAVDDPLVSGRIVFRFRTR